MAGTSSTGAPVAHEDATAPATTAAAERRDSTPHRTAGWWTVARKEFGDHISSARFIVLLAILALAAATTVYSAAAEIREQAEAATETPALFLGLFTLGLEQVPPFFAIVSFLVPLLGIAFGFDAVNAERSEGTLPRLLAQPIHRDDVVNGKFAGGLAIISLMLVALTLLVSGLGILRLGIVPTAAEVLRILAWVLVSIVYVGFWLAFATLCSVALRRAATSALVAIGVWLALTLFGTLLANLVAAIIAPAASARTADEALRAAQTQELLARLSPTVLYQEATQVLLNPGTRTLGAILPEQADRAIPSLLSLDQSLLLAWPQVVALVALTVLSFAGAYVLFMRQEVRA